MTYPLHEVVLATLVGVVCGADDWEGVEEVATGALDWLRGFLRIPTKPATHSNRKPATNSDLKPAGVPI